MYRKILLAYDGTREGRAVLKEGAELAQSCGADVHLLAVVNPPSGFVFADAVEQSGLVDSETQRFEQVLAEGAEKLRARGLKAEATLRHGNPTEEILAVANDIGAELIVLGHHRRGPIIRWWRGAVDADILADAPCSVLVAMAPEDEAASGIEGGDSPDAPV